MQLCQDEEDRSLHPEPSAQLKETTAQPTAAQVKLSSSPSGVLQRQCSGGCGNHTVAGGQCQNCKKRKDNLQRQLHLGEAHDVYEQEADRVADRVLASPSDGRVQNAPLQVQRFTGAPGGDPVSVPPSVDRTLSASGQPLATPLRRDMEHRFGHDFSRVRVHSSPSAAQSAAEINANAYTVGHDIVFGAGRFNPGTNEGRHLLAHELTHVVQQRGGGGETLHKQSNVIQRDVEDEGIETGEVTPSTSTPGSPSEFGPTNTDPPSCPRVPTGLSNVNPDPPCPSGEEPAAGRHFQFCTDSDAFRDPDQLSRLRSFARSQRADSIFKVHGYASTDGPSQGNLNLSCHRAKRTSRELENAGVPSQQIRVFAHGETTNFGPLPQDNQIALVGADAPEGQTTPSPTGAPTSLQDAVDRAVARIMARDYQLAADAYISRWTCGRIPNLAEMVRRTTILLEGDTRRTRISRGVLGADGDPRLGHPNLEGRHEVVLANEVFSEASDPTLCAAARIVDMGFHHFLAPQLGVGPNDAPVHSAALFLVGLAGFPPCETVAGNFPGTNIPAPGGGPWWRTPSSDPLASRTTGCDDQPLPGATDLSSLPARPERVPTFNVTNPFTETGGAPIPATLDRATNRLTVTPPGRAIVMAADVGASGDAAAISRYQVGWMHTVVADSMVVNYVGGQRVRREVPVPMRARSPLAANTPPWSNPAEVRTASPTAPVTTSFTAAPPATMEFLFEDPALWTPANRGTSLGQAENPINTAEVHTTFNAWVVARRDDAPLDRSSTHFLRGHEASLTMNVDVVGEETTATYASRVDLTTLTDSSPMQLRGSTEDQVSSDDRIVEVAPPTPRGQVANAMTIEQVRERVRQVGADLEPLREALHLDCSIMVRVHFNRETGRMIIDTDEHPATTIVETGSDEDREGVTNTGLRELGRAFTIRLRKELVLAPGIHETVPTAFNAPLPSCQERRRRRGTPDPFAPEHGIGPLAQLREDQELNRSAAQLRAQPNTYDPTFWPDVRVQLTEERYCFNFRVSGLDISQVCADQTMHTEGCVRPFGAESFSLRSDPRFVTQQLGNETFESPVGLTVTTFPMRFVLFTPSESPGGETFNHEMHHMIDSYNEIQTMKERMARRIRARLMQIRRLAADNPRLKASLLSRQTILEIVAQENQPFQNFFQREFLRRGDVMHAREAREGLPPYRTELPGSWTTYREPPLRGGTAGSFDDRPCS